MATQLSPNRVVRGVYLVVGFASLTLGVIGLFLPIMPTTVFVLVAAFFFARSSERLHGWIVDHPRFGRLVRDYQAGLGIPARAKAMAVAAISASFLVSTTFFVDGSVARLAMVVSWGAIVWYVLSQPTKKPAS